MLNTSRTFKFTRHSQGVRHSAERVAVDALNAINVWRALEGDRSIRLLPATGDEYLIAELTFPDRLSNEAMRDLAELCAEHGLTTELIADT